MLSSVEQVRDECAHRSPRGALVRGRGRSYGDAAQNAGGIVLDLSAMNRIQADAPDASIVSAGAGVSIRALMRWALPRGRFPAVVPGTGDVSIGGAVAADVHGKNHSVAGSFGNQLTRLELVDGRGGLRTLTPGGEPDQFWATVGGMGLTGAVTSASLTLREVHTAAMRATTTRVDDLEACLAAMSDAKGEYLVAWIDSLATGNRLGRAVITRGEHAAIDDLPRSWRHDPLRSPRSATLPTFWPWPRSPLTARTVGAFNAMWFRRAENAHDALVGVDAFFHPLDSVRNWNLLYGRGGFVQYQIAVPDSATDVLRTVLNRFATARYPTFLTVLKRLGAASAGHLSFPIAGWTLAVDIPATAPSLGAVLDELDAVVAGAGGRVYLAKDSRLSPAVIESMYPRLHEWRTARDTLDPDGRMNSDLGRRLGLTAVTARGCR